MPIDGIPWRGPGEDRPPLPLPPGRMRLRRDGGPRKRWRPGGAPPPPPLPPGRMPLRRDGGLRKRWRYVGVYGEAVMLCAARAEVGPTGQCFWALWARERGRELDHTSLRPGSREVVLDGPRVLIDGPDIYADLHLGEA